MRPSAIGRIAFSTALVSGSSRPSFRNCVSAPAIERVLDRLGQRAARRALREDRNKPRMQFLEQWVRRAILAIGFARAPSLRPRRQSRVRSCRGRRCAGSPPEPRATSSPRTRRRTSCVHGPYAEHHIRLMPSEASSRSPARTQRPGWRSRRCDALDELKMLSARRQQLPFVDDPRAVGHWEMRETAAGGVEPALRDARLPS